MRRLVWLLPAWCLRVLFRFTSRIAVGILETGGGTLNVAPGWRIDGEFVLVWFPTREYRERHLDVRDGALMNEEK